MRTWKSDQPSQAWMQQCSEHEPSACACDTQQCCEHKPCMRVLPGSQASKRRGPPKARQARSAPWQSTPARTPVCLACAHEVATKDLPADTHMTCGAQAGPCLSQLCSNSTAYSYSTTLLLFHNSAPISQLCSYFTAYSCSKTLLLLHSPLLFHNSAPIPQLRSYSTALLLFHGLLLFHNFAPTPRPTPIPQICSYPMACSCSTALLLSHKSAPIPQPAPISTTLLLFHGLLLYHNSAPIPRPAPIPQLCSYSMAYSYSKALLLFHCLLLFQNSAPIPKLCSYSKTLLLFQNSAPIPRPGSRTDLEKQPPAMQSMQSPTLPTHLQLKHLLPAVQMRSQLQPLRLLGARALHGAAYLLQLLQQNLLLLKGCPKVRARSW